MSSKARIGLLVAVHIVAGLLSAWYANTANSHGMSPAVDELMFIGLYALVYAQAGLIGIWSGLSTTRLEWRLPSVVAATAFVCIANTGGGTRVAFLWIALVAWPILLVLISLRHSRLGLQLAHLPNGLTVSKRFQFTIRHVLLATGVVAVVLGMGRGVRSINNLNTVAVMTYPPCFVMVELATLWATLGVGRPLPRLAVVVPTAFGVGTLATYNVYGRFEQAGFGSLWMLWSAALGLQAIITAVSLLVVRSCGWRMVSGAESTVMLAPEPISAEK